MSFGTIFQLSALDATTGFTIDGVAGDQFGAMVASAGDINNDGFDDFIVGVQFSDIAGFNRGAAYVVFGQASGFGASLDLTSLDGSNGFQLTGEADSDNAGRAVASAGDINGDGYDDLIIGAHRTDVNGSASGSAYIVFGRASGFAATLALADLDGSNGFELNGEAENDFSGEAVGSAGDFNGDGFSDLIIAARQSDANGSQSGAVYVVFGSDQPFPAALDLSSLDGSDGFRIAGVAANDYLGRSVSSAGDLNGDGLDDIIIGTDDADPNGGQSGAAYVVFGSTTSLAAFDLSGLDGSNGFRINGAVANDRAGFAVSAAGDVNGDGFGDIIVGARLQGASDSGAAYVLFGAAGGFAADIDLGALDGSSGFKISGEAGGDIAGRAVSAGDINGDGYDDLIVGAYFADGNGAQSGAAYVVFGRGSDFSADVSLGSLDGFTGFQLRGAAASDFAGQSVAGIGDINGDGIDDLIVGASGVNASAGRAYVVFGQAEARDFAGTAGADSFYGGRLADQLVGGGDKDRLRGLAGDDLIDGGDGNDQLFGGNGADDIIGGLGNDILDGGAEGDGLDGGDGADKLLGGAGTDLLDGGDGNDRIEGGDGIDTLSGSSGNDHLDGGTSADTMTGGAGNDVYIVDDAGDQTVELAGEGYDIVRSGLGWTLDDHFDGLQLQGSANVDGTGNALANNIQGNSGNNRLDGGAGVDTLNGGDGDDTIIGGLGNDLLRGGTGADVFTVAHGFGPVLETDIIYDFSTAEDDIIDLGGIDADINSAGDQAFILVSSFSKTAGEMTLAFSGGQTLLRLDVNGDGKVDFQLKINGDVTSDSAGWIF